MKFKLKCKVDSFTKIDNEIKFELNDKKYIFQSNRNGFLSSIEIITEVENPDAYFAKITPNAHGKGHHSMVIRSDESITRQLQEEMQCLEASIMFGGSPTKIDWENPERGWIPENEEEKVKINVLQISYERKYPQKITVLDEKRLISIIESRNDYTNITILEAFYNDGTRFFNEFKYINAFYNFYFVIEDLYGDGNTINRLIEKSFKESDDLRRFLENVRDNHILNHEKHSKSFIDFLDEMGKTTSTDDVIDFLVNTRGRLHHFSRKSTLRIGTPFNQREYEAIAFFVMGIALRAILQETYYINIELGIAIDSQIFRKRR